MNHISSIPVLAATGIMDTNRAAISGVVDSSEFKAATEENTRQLKVACDLSSAQMFFSRWEKRVLAKNMTDG